MSFILSTNTGVVPRSTKYGLKPMKLSTVRLSLPLAFPAVTIDLVSMAIACLETAQTVHHALMELAREKMIL